MNRTDRLLAIVLELQAKGWQRAEDLARTFEVSRRTIYRDMDALAETGVPVMSLEGRGFSLVAGYFLPPLSFSPDEAVNLLLGADYMAQNFDAQYRRTAQSAQSKIEAVLTEQQRSVVATLRDGLVFIAAQSGGDEQDKVKLGQIRRAIIEGKTLSFNYHAPTDEGQQSRQTTRQADPYVLLHHDRYWFLVAYCHLRKDKRNFRLSRMENVRVTTRTFLRSPDFVIEDDLQRGRLLTVKVLFTHDVVRWVQEEGWFYIVAEAPHPDGLLVTLQVRGERELLRWLLGWGANVQVLEPEYLRQTLAEHAQQVFQLYSAVNIQS